MSKQAVNRLEDKYFTPEIEDIRVGSEIWFTNGEEKDHWSTTLKDPHSVLNLVFGYMQDEKGTYSDYKIKNHIKFKYLTKEQIEAEGWTEGDTGLSVYETGEKIWIFRKRIYTIMYVAHRNYMEIHLADSHPTRYIYQGTCKDINTFRYIIKLLKQ